MERFDIPEEIALPLRERIRRLRPGLRIWWRSRRPTEATPRKHCGRRPLELNSRSPESAVLSRFVVDDQNGCGTLIQHRVAGASQ